MKATQKVTVTNPNSNQYGIGGEIISVNESTKRAQVDLGPCGIWGFNYSDLSLQGGPNKPVESTKQELPINLSGEKIKPVKRAYSKRAEKPKEVKVKRAYNRKKVD